MLMLSVYLEEKTTEGICYEQLSINIKELKKELMDMFTEGGLKWVEVYDITGQQLEEGDVEPAWLSYAVLSRSAEEAAKWAPLKVTLRKTDRTGHVLYRHPATTIVELQKGFQSLTGVPVHQQELLRGGQHLKTLTATIEQAGFRQSSMVHLIDLRVLPSGPNEYFKIHLQPAQSGLQSYEIEVSSGFSVERVKECASQIFAISLDCTLLTYCGLVLSDSEATLLDYKLVPGAFINVIDQKRPLKPRKEGLTIQVKLRETTRIVPKPQTATITTIKSRKQSEETTASFEMEEQKENETATLTVAEKVIFTATTHNDWKADTVTNL